MAMLAIYIISFLVLLSFYLYKYSITKPQDFPPGPPRLPIWGSYWFLLKENYYFSHKSTEILAKRYKADILGLFLGSTPAIVIFGYDLCKEVLTKEEFLGRNDTIVTRGRSFDELLGIFFVDGLYWQEQRRFSLRHLRDYGFGRRFTTTEEHFEKEVSDMIDMLTSKPRSQDIDICRKKGQILIPDLFYAPILNPLLHMLIGHRVDSRELRELARNILRFLRSSDSTGCALSITPWLRYIAPGIFGYTPVIKEHKPLIDFFWEEIQERKVNFSDDYHADLTDIYLSRIKEVTDNKENCTSFTDKQLLWTLIDYVFPTPVTIGQTLNYLWAYLINYPEIQVKIQEEIDTIVGRSRLPNLDDKKNMPYTEAVIRETLRKDPINPLGIPRRCTQDTKLRGYSIPKDTIVLPHLWSAGHDPKIWKDPENFKPERFLDSNGNLLKKDYIFGFGAGKRLCAGETYSRQIMFLFVSGLLQNFTFKATEKVPDPQEKIWGMLLGIANVWVEAVSR